MRKLVFEIEEEQLRNYLKGIEMQTNAMFAARRGGTDGASNSQGELFIA